MVTISLLGMDAYEAIDHTKTLGKTIAHIYDIAESDVEFFAPTSFIIHNGVEQTSFRLNVEVEAPYELDDREEEIKNAILDEFTDLAIHIRILFRYFDPEHEFVRIDDDYPLHMSEDNMVKVESDEEENPYTKYMDSEDEDDDYNGEEPYMGDILSQFDEYVRTHPDATNDDIYNALAGIRDEVSQKHAQDDK